MYTYLAGGYKKTPRLYMIHMIFFSIRLYALDQNWYWRLRKYGDWLYFVKMCRIVFEPKMFEGHGNFLLI